MTVAEKRMTKGERDELLRLVRAREKVLKSSTEQRSAELLVEFESKLSKTFRFDETENWKAAAQKVRDAALAFQDQVLAHLDSLGIPREFAPRIDLRWYDRGENASRQRRDELRRLAKAQIAAAQQKAIVEVEKLSVEAQAHIVQHGLESEAALSFFGNMTPVEGLMPTIDLKAIENKFAEKHGTKPFTLITGGLDSPE